MTEFEHIPGYSQILNNSIAPCRAKFDSNESQAGPKNVLNFVVTGHTITNNSCSC
jgi:hypothetical protein